MTNDCVGKKNQRLDEAGENLRAYGQAESEKSAQNFTINKVEEQKVDQERQEGRRRPLCMGEALARTVAADPGSWNGSEERQFRAQLLSKLDEIIETQTRVVRSNETRSARPPGKTPRRPHGHLEQRPTTSDDP
ncbi:hypothetical protein FMEXI_9658 [Fusarium mexicanum]|uniref:Uncharacterized protein n=1 Tax=Fusarium mexicanum TaxID=751941 RepID=A0A8H5IJD0_9HYPO|nr:hypothetical protein FMEXI_9658 [Fusarium mexicanum]